MSLNLKSEEVHRLARELSALTGENMTAAVAEALRQRIERLRHERTRPVSLAERLLEIGRDCAGRLKEPWRSAEHGDLLYGDDGLPK